MVEEFGETTQNIMQILILFKSLKNSSKIVKMFRCTTIFQNGGALSNTNLDHILLIILNKNVCLKKEIDK